MRRLTASKSDTASAAWLSTFRIIIGKLLAWLGTAVFPSVLVGLCLIAFAWQYAATEFTGGTVLPLAVWEDQGTPPQDKPLDALAELGGRPARNHTDTRLSANPFWFSLTAAAPAAGEPWAVDFPSRHAMRLDCWNQHGGALLGQANRSVTDGQISPSRAGFALRFPASQPQASIVCSGDFRGPARISANAWSRPLLAQAEAAYQKSGAMIEAGIGVLALFMLLTAMVNRSALYWAFVGWLLLNMRMAALSAGTDFALFGLDIPAGWLVTVKQWTVCMYYAMTIALFSLLFKEELADVKAGWPLTLHQFSAVVIMAVCPFVAFESILPVLWVTTFTVVAVMMFYLYCILRRHHSRVAVWYAASIVVTLAASLNEVVAAATGQRNLLGGLNSVTAAIASALLASAAVAEHMRSDRLQKLEVQQTLKNAYEDSPIGLFTLQEGDRIAKSNPAFQAMLQGIAPDRLTHLSRVFESDIGQAIETLRSASNRSSIELQTRVHEDNTSADGDRWFAIKASSTDGDIVEGSLQDITDKVRAMGRLEFLVNHDPLTECLNLRGIARSFERAAQQPTALAYFDLDRFKLINDLYGHSAGDAVLRQVCERMKSQLHEGDLLARVGGDEFVVAFPDASIAQARQRCENLAALISSTPYLIETQSFALSVSGGLVETARFGTSTMKELVSAADTVCRIAKKRPAERLVVIESSSSFFKHHQEELALITCLEQGKAPDGLFLVMQPEISLTAPFDSLNFEVLLRMRKPNGDTVPAGVIIEAAEAHGKTAIIDRWVVTTVIAWLEAHAHQLTNTRFVGVNLSGGSLNDEAFVEELFALFEQHQAALSMICLEITETVALTDMSNMQRFIDRARSMGAKVGLDDFGAGYSSFGYLKGLSVDALKLDGSLVRDAPTNPSGMAIIVAIGGLVRSLGMKSVGEFAEDLPTIKALVAAGVDYAQGYGISKPVMPERILQARSGADFIEDPEILAFIQQLQAQTDKTIPLFGEFSESELRGLIS